MPLNPLSPIFNAASVTLDQTPGTLPNVADALLQWFQPLIFGVLTKTIVNFQVQETAVDTTFFGVWQPMTSQKLQMKPEGQRAWEWVTVHALPSPALQPDDVILRNGIQFRVSEKRDYTQYGYIEYELVNDYSGSGPGSY
jgi:hypothetical protein